MASRRCTRLSRSIAGIAVVLMRRRCDSGAWKTRGAMMTEAVIYEMIGAVAVITINRPESRNAINSAVRQGLIDAWRRFETDPAALVAILTGAGDKAVCAGMDLKEASAMGLKVPARGCSA